MFKHLVLWQFSPEVSPARRETLIRELDGRFRAMVGQVEGLQKAEIGQNLLPDSGYHMILYTEFTNREAMEAYQNHPPSPGGKRRNEKYRLRPPGGGLSGLNPHQHTKKRPLS